MASRLRCDHKRVESVVHREGLNRHVYKRCPDCGSEWTETETVSDLADPVTSSEVISVHEALADLKTLEELLDD